MTNTTESKKLSPGTSWLFALGSVGAAVAITFALSGLGQKANAAIYFAIVAAGGFASTYLTRAKLGSAILGFLASAAIAAVAYYFLVGHIVAAATSMTVDVAALGDAKAHTAGQAAGGFFGAFFGIFVAIIVFLETLIAGIVGSVAGHRSRGQGGLAAVGALARSAS